MTVDVAGSYLFVDLFFPYWFFSIGILVLLLREMQLIQNDKRI